MSFAPFPLKLSHFIRGFPGKSLQRYGPAKESTKKPAAR